MFWWVQEKKMDVKCFGLKTEPWLVALAGRKSVKAPLPKTNPLAPIPVWEAILKQLRPKFLPLQQLLASRIMLNPLDFHSAAPALEISTRRPKQASADRFQC